MSNKIFQIIRIKSNINIIVLFIIFIISIINVKSNSNSNNNLLSLYYKPIFLTNGKSIIIKKNGIYTYNKKIKKKYIFQNENEFPPVLSKQDIEQIFIFEKIFPKNLTFIFIKKFLYIFSEKGEIILKNKFMNETYLKNYKILFHSNYTINNTNTYFYYFLFYKKSNNKIVIDIFEYNYSSNLNNIVFSHIIDISKSFKEKFTNLEENFNCEFMSRTIFKEKILICFLENENQIISIVYKINIEEKQILLLSLKTADIKLNHKIGKIKTFISEDKVKSLICNYENFQYYKCIIYDANKNIFNGYNNYLNNCQNSFFSLDLVFMKEIEKYIFYCFTLSKELNFVILNEDLEIEKNGINKNINVSKYIKSYINNIYYNKIFPFLTKKRNLYYNIGIKSRYINITHRQLENNNEESQQNEKIEGEDNNQNGEQIPNGGQDQQNENNPNEGQNQQNENNPNEGQNQQNENDPIEGQGQQNENNPNDNIEDNKDGKDGKEGPNSGGDKNFDFDFEKGRTNMTKEEIRENRGSIMENYEHGKSYKMQGDGFDIKVAPMGEKEEGSTYIDFQSCEAKLREKYGLNESAVLSVFQTQTTSTNEKSITNKVQYVVYDEDNNQLDLSVCNDEKIKINYAIRNDTTLDTTKLKSFGDKGIDILTL